MPPTETDNTLARRLGLFDATMIVMGGIIGSGIFMNPAVVAREVFTPFLVLSAWIVGGLFALAAAFIWAELAERRPDVGGQYVYLREAFHPAIGFLYGWVLLLVVQTGGMAAVAVTFAESTFDQEDAIQGIRICAGSAFDPEAIRVFVRAIPKAAVPRKEKEVLLSELTPGMVLAKGIYTSNGLLLIPEGQQLSGPSIDKLLNHNRINPINQSLVVYC